MAKPSSPKALADLIDRLAPALRRTQGSGADRGPRVALMAELSDNGPATMRDLASHLHVSPQAVTGLVDQLEAEGLLARERHPTDRRKTVIRLNDHARENVKAARAARTDGLSSLFADIPKEDRAAFARVARTLLDRLS
ncbi:DNA-binding transcriptional regulator, MarR family [Jannaschia faecimaris]|uniref:DNA-binding transcriptional regulator, MarR family n=1 Tax=Jannaschia faecimaris TaxID=1244108 RepID=A0A1H3PPK0_9RHOB|nr:MarR family transcriptional regulator [Jannaschia faecimaris]SDZ03162.1 DNA-binding transcriptional regulator, MarR family [Jannaschia faecimaris]